MHVTSNSVTILQAECGLPLVTYVPRYLDGCGLRLLTEELNRCARDFKSGFTLVGELWVKTPRLVAEYGDGEFVFPDTGPNQAMPPEIRELRDRLERDLGTRYNYALANKYRTGADFTGWHADKMHLHAPGSNIAMISVGATRRFEFRSTRDCVVVAGVEIEEGSLLVMGNGSQHGFEHSLRPDQTIRRPRVSLTFRHLLPTGPSRCTCADSGDVSGAA